MLKRAVSALSQVFICIDILDKCFPKHLLEIFESLKEILLESPRTRIFVTGRPHFEAQTVRYFADEIIIPISPTPAQNSPLCSRRGIWLNSNFRRTSGNPTFPDALLHCINTRDIPFSLSAVTSTTNTTTVLYR